MTQYTHGLLLSEAEAEALRAALALLLVKRCGDDYWVRRALDALNDAMAPAAPSAR